MTGSWLDPGKVHTGESVLVTLSRAMPSFMVVEIGGCLCLMGEYMLLMLFLTIPTSPNFVSATCSRYTGFLQSNRY
jgi:hypothetical protein